MNVIQIEDLWKEYRLGVIGHGTLMKDLQSWWARLRDKDDPNAKISPLRSSQINQVDGDRFWALKGINLEIKQGEVVGIIGKNGAGKSTLLKVLSRVTAPTQGTVKIKGRIASLLEVGTGFHPELTGRENAFLNGAILGMSKQEVKNKLDEIIDFSGVEKFIDTPVKRYSSGMYVRLAFAVAAHLEPEIMIVDEVLAVGDTEFQKKCLGKMGKVASEGRTVLFVSHNMGAVNKLCTCGVCIEDGSVKETGEISQVVEKYLFDAVEMSPRKKWDSANAPGNDDVKLLSVEVSNEKGTEYSLTTDENLFIHVVVDVRKQFDELGVSLIIRNSFGQNIVHSSSLVWMPAEVVPGVWSYVAKIQGNTLNRGDYALTIAADVPNKEMIFVAEGVLSFSIESKSVSSSMYAAKAWSGVLCPEAVIWNKSLF